MLPFIYLFFKLHTIDADIHKTHNNTFVDPRTQNPTHVSILKKSSQQISRLIKSSEATHVSILIGVLAKISH